MRHLLNAQDKIETWFSYIAAGVVAIITLLTEINVLLRKFRGAPLIGYIEFVVLVFVALAVCSMPIVQRNRGHLGIEFIVERIPRRGQLLCSIFVQIISFLFLGLLVWQSWLFMLDRWAWFTMGVVRIPWWPVLIWLPPAFLLTSLRMLRQMFEDIVKFKKNIPKDKKTVLDELNI